MAVRLIFPIVVKSRYFGTSWYFIDFRADWEGGWSSIDVNLLPMVQYQPIHGIQGCGSLPRPLSNLAKNYSYAKSAFRGRVIFFKIRRLLGIVIKYPCRIEATIHWSQTYPISRWPTHVLACPRLPFPSPNVIQSCRFKVHVIFFSFGGDTLSFMTCPEVFLAVWMILDPSRKLDSPYRVFFVFCFVKKNL